MNGKARNYNPWQLAYLKKIITISAHTQKAAAAAILCNSAEL
jgi:hypothetical protein